MRYFIDSEFYEDGEKIHPISLGVVCEDGRELYMEFDFSDVAVSDWIQENVVPHLTWLPEARLDPKTEGRVVLENFIGEDPDPEFWAYFADYDWVLFCQMFGTMIELPSNFPKFCMDLKQWWVHLGEPRKHKSKLRPPKPESEHHALADARWNKAYWDNLKQWEDSH